VIGGAVEATGSVVAGASAVGSVGPVVGLDAGSEQAARTARNARHNRNRIWVPDPMGNVLTVHRPVLGFASRAIGIT